MILIKQLTSALGKETACGVAVPIRIFCDFLNQMIEQFSSPLSSNRNHRHSYIHSHISKIRRRSLIGRLDLRTIKRRGLERPQYC